MTSARRSRQDFEAQQAAYLCAEHEMTQAAIGRVLGGLSQSRVSRLLRRAEEAGWLVRRYRFVGGQLPAERMASLKRLVEPKSLVEALAGVESKTGVLVRDVHVVDSGAAGQARKAVAAQLGRFGRAAADPLWDVIRRSEFLAVTWGTTVSHCVEGLKVHTRPSISLATRFVPVCGEPLDRLSNRDTSSQLALRLHQIAGSTAPLPPSLSGVPALISRQFSGRDAEGIRKFVAQAASYKEIFGTASPLIKRVDSLLTAVGPSSKPMGFIHDELLKAGSTRKKKLTSVALSKLVAGDVGGVLFPRPGLDAGGRAEVDALNRMWTGAKLSHLERIASQASNGTRPGIVVVAMGGDDRAEILAEAVRHGLVNELIIDRTLADSLTRALRS
jgi:DNA-binding transcriptional regulator LsrR (DeoR family)